MKVFKAIIIFFALGLFFSLVNHRQEDLKETVKASLKSCGQDRLDYVCLEAKLVPIIKTEGGEKVIQTIDEVFNEASGAAYGTLSCHGPVHLVGEIMVRQGFSLGDIYRRCQKICDYGCEHGAFMENVKTYGEITDLVPNLCSQYQNSKNAKDLVSCQHVVGHGLTEYFARDLAATLSICDRFVGEAGRAECARGALMEYFYGSPGNIAPDETRAVDLLEFCSRLDPLYEEVCLEQVGFYTYSFTLNGRKAKEICERVPAKLRADCSFNLGGRIYFVYKGSENDLLNFCRETSSWFDCVLGAVDTDANSDKKGENSNNLCLVLDEPFKSDCLAFLEERLKYAWGE